MWCIVKNNQEVSFKTYRSSADQEQWMSQHSLQINTLVGEEPLNNNCLETTQLLLSGSSWEFMEIYLNT